MLYRSGPTVGNGSAPLTVSKPPPPRMTVAEVRQRLDLTGFLFANDGTRRGKDLYHRYDGHCGA